MQISYFHITYTNKMYPFRKILLIVSLFVASAGFGQNQIEHLSQTLATSNFNELKTYWSPQVEVSIESTLNSVSMSAAMAQQAIVNFYNQKGVINFEKTADRQLGNITYITGKLLADRNKYNITIMLQVNKSALSIISLRIN